MAIAADYPLLEVFGTIAVFFIGLAWVAMVAMVIVDVLRRRDLSGARKAGWTILVVFAPIVGPLIYLIVHGTLISGRVGSWRSASEPLRSYYDPSPGARAGVPPRPI